MYLIKAGDAGENATNPVALRGRTADFEKARKKALQLLKTYEQVEILDAATNDCVLYLTR